MYDWIVLENYKTYTICLNFSYLHCLVSQMKENRIGVLSNGWFLLSLPPTAIIASMCTHFPQSMKNCKTLLVLHVRAVVNIGENGNICFIISNCPASKISATVGRTGGFSCPDENLNFCPKNLFSCCFFPFGNFPLYMMD